MSKKKILRFPRVAQGASEQQALLGADGIRRFLRKRSPDHYQLLSRPVLPLPGPDGIFRFIRLDESAPDHHQRFPRLKITDDKDPATLTALVHRARKMMMGDLRTMRLEMGHIFCRIRRKVWHEGASGRPFT